MLTEYPAKEQFSQGKLVWEERLKSEPLFFTSWQITFRILFFVPPTN